MSSENSSTRVISLFNAENNLKFFNVFGEIFVSFCRKSVGKQNYPECE